MDPRPLIMKLPSRLLPLTLLLPLLLPPGPVSRIHATPAEPADTFRLAPDSSNFVKASLMIAEPLTAIYSVFGHATLRMECPIHHLDYVFTFESDPDVSAFMTGIAGTATAKFVPVPAEVYIEDARKQGRELWQYELNLNLHEKQNLWRMLDEETAAGAYRHFNLFYTNCLTTSILTVQRCLIGERFEWGPMRFPHTMNDGFVFRYTLRHAPWSGFLFITFSGSAYDYNSITEYRLTPETIIQMLRDAKIVDDATGESRHVVTDPGQQLVKGTPKPSSPLTPTVVFGALLVITLLITAAERWLRWKRLARVYDILLFIAQALIFALMVYITFISELFRGNWNWYFVATFPLPLLLLFRRPSPTITRLWLIYSCVLALFILATPFIALLDLPHQLVTATFLTRSLSHYFSTSRQTRNLSR